ncbi:MAG: PilZ domain-containing protein [Rhodospirillales bacterium]
MDGKERRVWERHNIEKVVDIKTVQHTHSRDLDDMSAGGASVHGSLSEADDELVEIVIDDFGNFPASVVREWDDGFAVQFDIEEDEKFSLQEDLEAFRRENDLMPE